VSAAAFFDVDGTITKTTILDPLIWYRRAHDSKFRFSLFALGMLVRAPYYLALDRRSRARCNVVFYRRYAGLSAAELHEWHQQTFAENLQRTIFPAALDCIREHQRQGHGIVLVTGGLDFVMRPLKDYLHADQLVATPLVVQNGALTGAIDGQPIADERKAEIVRSLCDTHGIDPALSFAYGNSLGDAPMLECVGHPVAVNADSRSRRLAVARGWSCVTWKL
jgi:HAD superfamily hydrolase (TIGR01490 family)